MSYVNTKTKKIVEVSDILAENRHVSFPAGGWTDEILADLGYAELHFPETMSPGPYEKLVEGVPVKVDGKWYRSFTVEPVSEKEKQDVITKEFHKIREERTIRLAQSDWTQLPDAQINSEEWLDYRQKLRDITENLDDPFAVKWPNPPVSRKEQIS